MGRSRKGLRSNVFQAVRGICASSRWHASLVAELVPLHLFEDSFPHQLMVIRYRLHQGLHEIFRRLYTQDREHRPFRLDPQCFLVRAWI